MAKYSNSERTLFVLIVVGLLFVAVMSFRAAYGLKSAIEEGVPYSLGYTYLADLVGDDGQIERARIFDFADRNLPEKSIIVPLEDANGVLLVKRNSDLPVNTVQKVRIKIAKRTIEGEAYPAYEFVRWEYNPGTTETQSVVPQIIPQH